MTPLRINLAQDEIPTHWYNVVADMPNAPLPPLGPDGNPATPEQMGAIFPAAILEQEMSAERWIPIPQPVREIYRLWRPSPLVRAARMACDQLIAAFAPTRAEQREIERGR